MEDIKSSEEIFGARLLQEVRENEESLESLLNTLQGPSSKTGIPDLDTLCLQNHQPRLSISGRSLPLLLQILTRLLSAPCNKTVVLIDLASRFSPSFLNVYPDDVIGSEGKLKVSDLKHLHVFRPHAKNLESTLRSVEGYLLYGDHMSGERAFGGTMVLGGEGLTNAGVEGKDLGLGKPVVSVGWRGWLRVEREETAAFGAGMSADEILGERETRWEVVERKGWKVVADSGVGRGGEFRWKEE
ncbi:hypothetical protein ACMFMG_005765 [Clarireedia jacksonii]